MIFRVDDVSLNTDIDRLEKTIETILGYHPTATIMLAVSLITFDIGGERMNPGILNVYSDHKNFFKGSQLGLPDLTRFDTYQNVQIASHGFIHVDHRLLTESLVEWNIIQSCAIICPLERVFVPPYHKWDEDVESVCVDNDIELVKVEDGWKHLAYHKIKDSILDTSLTDMKYYFHTFDFENSYEMEEQLTKEF